MSFFLKLKTRTMRSQVQIPIEAKTLGDCSYLLKAIGQSYSLYVGDNMCLVE